MAFCNCEIYKLPSDCYDLWSDKYSTLSNIYKCKKSILGTLDLHPLIPIEYHASYLPTKYEIHLSINKGCMGKNVKIYFEHWWPWPNWPLTLSKGRIPCKLSSNQIWNKQIRWIYIPRRVLVIINTTTEDIRLYLYINHGINSNILWT
jgi:hypothetical protein